METTELTLVVKEKTIGSLVTNAKDIKAFVKDRIKEYSVDNYTGDDKQAAKDKAELNNAAKKLNDDRIVLEKEWLKPFQEFKDVVTETTNMIKTASNKLDVIVKAKEEEEKAEKKSSIYALWNEKKFNLVTLDKVFSSKWLNKTYKLGNIKIEIDSIIDTINKDLAALDAFGEDTALLKDLYLTTLNLQATLQKGAELKANRERLTHKAQQNVAEKARIAEMEAQQAEVYPAVETTEAPTGKVAIDPVVEKTQEVKPQSNAPKYNFIACGNELALSQVRSIAEECNMDFVPALQLTGSAPQIAQFKKALIEFNACYEKTNFISLVIKNN